MKKIASIPLADVERIEIRVTRCQKTLSQVKAETGATHILNGGMWNDDLSPCPLLKVDGKMLAGADYDSYGYGWDHGPDIQLTPSMKSRSFISCTCLIAPWGPVDKPSYDKIGQGGTRGRSAIGLKDGALCLYCSSDGSSDARTPERLRDELAALRAEQARALAVAYDLDLPDTPEELALLLDEADAELAQEADSTMDVLGYGTEPVIPSAVIEAPLDSDR